MFGVCPRLKCTFIPTQLQGQSPSATLLRVLQQKVSAISQEQSSFDWKSESWKTLTGDSHTCFMCNLVIFNTNEPSDFNHSMGCSYKKSVL